MVNLIVFPADTLCNDKVIMTPKRRRDAYIRKQQQKTTTTIIITMKIIIMITMIITMMMIMITMIKWHDDNDNNYYYYDKVWCSFILYLFYLCYLSYWRGGFSEVTAINLINHFDIYLFNDMHRALAGDQQNTAGDRPCQHDQMNRSYVARQRADVPRPNSAAGSRMVASRQLAHHRAEWCPAAIL